ncbi:hypothetical protein PG994_012438 [Apiospora phragmitis]|uniref:Rhodopsin domain-containing protein n=1 Tax=Apiospora phragmitis TaxID=2905665 RepID=A0ABR1TVY7_9PEZI
MKVSLLVFVTATARVAASHGSISRVVQQRHAASQVSQHPRGLLPDGVTTTPPACALKCQVQFAPATFSSDPIQKVCSKQIVPEVSDKLKACLVRSCTVPELLQAKRLTAELSRKPQTDLGPMILAVIWATESISVIAVVLRVLARTALLETSRFEVNRWGWDDTTITVVLAASLVAEIIVSLVVVEGGYGKDVWMLTPSQITYGLKCWPVSYAWTWLAGQDQGTCWDYGASVTSHGALNMASDWIIFIMSIKNLVELNMKRAKKIVAIAVLAWGLGGSVCSVFRLIELVHATRADSQQGDNITLRLAKILMWSTAEFNSTLFCACMPTAVQVIRRIMYKADASYPRSHKLPYGQSDDNTGSQRTAITKASRRGHLSLKLTNISEVALDGIET